MFESGSIMQYLTEQYDTEHKVSYPKGSREGYEVNNWLFFLNAGYISSSMRWWIGGLMWLVLGQCKV